MFSFKWSYDYGKIKAIYNGEWKQLNQCSAAIAHTVSEDDNVKIDTWFFNSYVTPIMMIESFKFKSYNVKSHIDIRVNKEYFGCSRTTIAQTNKFLDYVGAFMIFGYRYRDIKDALKRLESSDETFEYLTDSNSPTVYACNDETLRTVFKRCVGCWTCHSI
jgi:ribosomal protein S19